MIVFLFFTFMLTSLNLAAQLPTPEQHQRCPAIYSSRKAHNFALNDIHGVTQQLAAYEGKQVILHFLDHPFNNNSNFFRYVTQAYAPMQASNIVLMVISSAPLEDLQKIAQIYTIPFLLLHDADKKVSLVYDALTPYNSCIRSTLIVDEHGFVIKAIIDGSVKDHLAEIFLHAFKHAVPLTMQSYTSEQNENFN
ncbi:redoxin domain-containing protein [Candidatus Babeliales bacterium]|nr:redoxin domain-containing protein [Candidatus Babeliales bacterium]